MKKLTPGTSVEFGVEGLDLVWLVATNVLGLHDQHPGDELLGGRCNVVNVV